MSDKATVDEIYKFFLEPNRSNRPEGYATDIERSIYLTRVINNLFEQKENFSILELGSNVGRNLHYLKEAGWSVFGIEGSSTYYNAIEDHFHGIKDLVLLGQLQDVLPKMTESFSLIFTMAVLEHIPPAIQETVFSNIERLTNWLLTIEDERCDQWNHFPRDYQVVFETHGFKQIDAWTFPPLGVNFVMRLFRKKERDQ